MGGFCRNTAKKKSRLQGYIISQLMFFGSIKAANARVNNALFKINRMWKSDSAKGDYIEDSILCLRLHPSY